MSQPRENCTVNNVEGSIQKQYAPCQCQYRIKLRHLVGRSAPAKPLLHSYWLQLVRMSGQILFGSFMIVQRVVVRQDPSFLTSLEIGQEATSCNTMCLEFLL
jgi:hypothetical protein